MTATTFYSYVECSIGPLLVRGDGEFLTGLYLPNHKGYPEIGASWQRSDAHFAAVREQLDEYFAGERQQFDVPLNLAGTPFQKQVWHELTQIPFGTTITYAQLAQRVGIPTASRAVGSANGRNPISIIVPCHRVIGTSGKLTGYAGGIEKKKWLLDFERQVVAANFDLNFEPRDADPCVRRPELSSSCIASQT